ncbi:hypothetical protein HOP61_08165 [Halomonas daqingensis]|uniref:Uncharacterized protein n=1 Tax=Billgrantia desiderata TaxID=52021 RepID=A0AAW4YRP7_9GAMM|nr:hypothetical protein [Halomonas desiderata]MCE8051263.1 hypothetical protein [Halomonas desiderata]
MTDFDFWKRQYQDTWGRSSQRETDIAEYLAHESGACIVPVGLGAGSTTFLPGPASSHGASKGDADLMVKGTDIYLEVTGPLVQSVDHNQGLWVRPDKVENARQNMQSKETWVVHHLPKGDLIRVILLGEEFFQALKAGDFSIVSPRIRGNQEQYYEIPATHRCVQPLQRIA